MAQIPETCTCASNLQFAFPGERQRLNKMQGHWLLARAGKRVLLPGGLDLARRMLNALNCRSMTAPSSLVRGSVLRRE